MASKKKEPLAAATGKGSSDGDVSSYNHSITKSTENQPLLDLVEEDPTEPENPKDVKGKFWCFILYPDSAPENWVEILNMSGLPWTISPLHKKDFNADLTPKKPHYHVIIIWGNSTTYSAVKKFTHQTMCGTIPQLLHSPVGYYRYFTHKDNPEKAQYDECEIKSGNGFDVSEYQKLSKQEKLEMHAMLTQAVIDHGIWIYADACEMALSMGWDEYEVLTSHTIHFTQLCKSVKYKMCRSDRKEIEV